jgi:hypothetical protein
MTKDESERWSLGPLSPILLDSHASLGNYRLATTLSIVAHERLV